MAQLKDIVRDRNRSHTVAPAPELADELFRRKAAVSDKHAATMDGRLIRRFSMSGTGQRGTVRFRGAEFAPMYFEVLYEDGSSELADSRGLRALRPYPQGTKKPNSTDSSLTFAPPLKKATFSTNARKRK